MGLAWSSSSQNRLTIAFTRASSFLVGCGPAGRSNRIVLTTRPSCAERNRIVMVFASAAGKVLASSRSNRRERSLVVIFVSRRHGDGYGVRCAITPL
jgi:hypothetical protein